MLSLSGKPKDTLDIPREVLHPVFSLMSFNAFTVFVPASGSTLIVMQRVSKIKSSFFMPYFSASLRILRAISNLPSGVCGIPFSSSVKAIIAPPYFFASGNTASILSFFPFTELINALPLYILNAFSIASLLDVSICNGRSMISCNLVTVFGRTSTSLMSGIPTFTSKTSAPHSL